MKSRIATIFASVVLAVGSVSGYSQDDAKISQDRAGEELEGSQPKCVPKDNSLYRRLKSIEAKATDSKIVVGEMVSIMEDTVDRTRCYQGLVYKFARAINQNISQTEQGLGTEYLKEIYTMTDNLVSSTYDDRIFDSNNLSRIIENRLPLLLEDSEKIKNGSKPGSSTERLRKRFKQEMAIFTDKFLSAKRVKVGIGAALSYLPDVSYQSSASIDFSPYISTSNIPAGSPLASGPDRIRFDTSFSEKKFDSLVLRAATNFAAVDLSIPDYDVDRSFNTIVALRDLNDPGRQILHRSRITSKLEIKYNIHIRFSIFEALHFFRPDKYASPQFDYGFGFGFTGMDITDKVTTDMRFTTMPGQTFEELSNGALIESSNKRSITASYFSLFNRMKMTDSLEFGMEVRSYRKESEGSGEIDVKGETLSTNLIYYF